MIYTLSIASDIKYSVLDILRGIGMGIVNIIFKTIDILYDVAHSINSLNFIKMLENIENSPFTKIFNAFFILAFAVLFLFSVWKITFRILDADANEQPLFELIKEIVKCGFLIFSIYLIFNTTINLGINLSNAIYNNFNTSNSTIGDKMKTSYLTVNESCYKISGGESTDKENVSKLKSLLTGYSNTSSVNTMSDFEKLLRNETITASDVSDSGSFSFRCQIYKPGIWNDGEDYAFSYNFLFGIVIGVIFLFAIGFAVLMLGRRQLELAFLMVISPLVIATSVGRKEQRSALYQQLASLVLQAGALMLLIGLTAIMFNAIQNSADINKLSYFTKIVAQSVLYLGCAMMLMTGCTSLNRFIGENVSANSGRDMMMAFRGLGAGIASAGAVGVGAIGAGIATAKGGMKAGKGIGQLAKGGIQTAKGMYHGVASVNPNMKSGVSSRMSEKVGKGLGQMMKGADLQNSKNPIARSYGRMLESSGESKVMDAASKWDFKNDKYNVDYVRGGVSLAQQGISNIKEGFGGAFNSIKNIGNPHSIKYRSRPRIYDYGSENDRI
ncbi:MAG: hypothetical protein J6B64_03030 [Bacilli bacterium]|nr:hypothetical protein [Bacilli bacterium]MBO5376355.1 hypothetical protein [Bacilli bacterium]MBP3597606.1 hypothetical protein [Clostridia bacterium]